jgi:hypothetical protein
MTAAGPVATGTFTLTMASARWDDLTAPELAGTPIGELVAGLDEIGAQSIPYGLLPGRARTVYSPLFSTWSDLAGETISSLIKRPKGGAATVRAIVTAASAAVASARAASAKRAASAATATKNLLDRLTERDRMLLSARVWGLRTVSRHEAANLLGVHADSIYRVQPRSEARLADLLADPAHRDVIAFAERLHHRVGPLARLHTVEAVLSEFGLELSGAASQLLLHLAGPYTPWGDSWLATICADGRPTASVALDTALTRLGAPSTARLLRELARAGMPAESALDFVESQPELLRRFGDRWVRWGDSIADQAEAVLHLSGVPAEADAIAAAIGQDCQPGAVRYAMSRDDRFARAGPRTWALRRWGLDEYAGVYAAIAERIDAAGGTIGVTAVLHDMMATFPDVAESSVRTYLGTPGFVLERGVVRRRTEADGWPPAPPLSTARGAFHNGPNEIRLAVAVTNVLLRGSGQFIHPAVARALGVCPGQERLFSGGRRDVRITWLLSSTSGAAVGSLRSLAVAVDARAGDTLVLVFGLDEASVGVERVRSGDDPRTQTRALLGRSVPDPAAGFALALDCRAADVEAVLRWRGDDRFTELLTQ